MQQPANPDVHIWNWGNGMRAAYSCVADGDMRDATCRRRWLQRLGAPAELAVGAQVHGTRIAVAGQIIEQPEPGIDAWLATGSALTIGAFGADCPGLILDDGRHQIIAHCGWRGIAAGMVTAAIAGLREAGSVPCANWHAFIGPGISAAHYQVDRPVLDAYPWPAAAVQWQDDDHALLDLVAAMTSQLTAAGIGTITTSDWCTATRDDLHSYRHQGRGPQQLLVTWRV